MTDRPTIVTLCGSTRFYEQFRSANFRETLQGRMVFSIGCDFNSDEGLELTQADKSRLDKLHLAKIAASDEILVINYNGYIGESTRREIAHAVEHGKRVRYLEFHTKDCIGYMYQTWNEIQEYAKQWPHYCRVCNGQGQFQDSYDPSPPGVSLGSGYMIDYVACDKCTSELLCARCGEKTLTEDGEGPCYNCGWNYDDEAPAIYECSCYEVQMIEWERKMLLGDVYGDEPPPVDETNEEVSRYIHERYREEIVI